MATEEKKTPEKVQVTSGKDFVASKPHAAEKAPADKPKDIVPSGEEIAAHEKRMRDLEDEHQKRVDKLAAEETKLKVEHQVFLEKQRAEREELAAIAAAESSRSNELGKAHFAGDNVQRQGIDPGRVPQGLAVGDPDHPTNARGAPIPVEEQKARVRHISEIGDGYNGKPDTLED